MLINPITLMHIRKPHEIHQLFLLQIINKFKNNNNSKFLILKIMNQNQVQLFNSMNYSKLKNHQNQEGIYKIQANLLNYLVHHKLVTAFLKFNHFILKKDNALKIFLLKQI